MEEGMQKGMNAAEAAEYAEFRRYRRETEISVTLKRLTVDASRRETDKTALKNACACARKLKADGVLVSPVNVASARRLLAGSGVRVCCLVGGTGESLISVKKTEAKKAARQGAKEIRLVCCYSALTGGNVPYLKREIKRVRKAVKKCAFVLSLEDHTLGIEQIATGVRAAREARADGVCVRGETAYVICAADAGGDKIKVDCSGVENAEQLRLLLKTGIARASTGCADRIAEELYRDAERSLNPPQPKPKLLPSANIEQTKNAAL